MLTINDWMELCPGQTWLPITPEDETQAWEQAIAHPYSNPRAQERAYYHYLSLRLVQNWLAEQEPQRPVTLPMAEHQLPSLFDVVDGIALMLGEIRLVLIPDMALNLDELRVPQEWIDIPDWAADYYLALQLDLDQHWVQMVGYASHSQMKTDSHYDVGDRTYSLDASILATDLDILLMAQTRNPEGRSPLPALQPLTKQQIASYLSQLSQPSLYSPRLTLPFAPWASLLADTICRENLYQARISNQIQTVAAPVSSTQTVRGDRVNLRNWAAGLFSSAWEAMQDFVEDDMPLALAKQAITGEAGGDTNRVTRGYQIHFTDCVLRLGVSLDYDNATPQTDLPPLGVCLKAELIEPASPPPASLTLTVSYQDPETDERVDLFEREIVLTEDTKAIQLSQMIVSPGDAFSITLSLGNETVTQDFVG